MKKRVLCLFLGVVMLLSMALTACSGGEEAAADVDDVGAQTITMRIVSDKKVCNNDDELAKYLADECGGDKDSAKYKDMLKTMAAYEAVEAEFSKLTKSKYKINVDLMFYTAEEYENTISAVMDEYALESKNVERAEKALKKYVSDYREYWESKNGKDTFTPDIEALVVDDFYARFPEYSKYKGQSSEDGENVKFEEQYKENEDGIQELVYPEAEKNQLDIIYISGLDMYKEFVNNEWIINLDGLIDTTGKKLKTYIAGSLLAGVKMDGATYAIPNNVMIGKYTYMLVDRELYDKWYGPDYMNVEDVLDIGNFLNDIVNNENESEDPKENIIPIDADFDQCISYFVRYWNLDQHFATDKDGKLLEAVTYKRDKEGDIVYKDGKPVVDKVLNIPVSYTVNNGNEFSLLGTLYGDPAKVGRGQIAFGFNPLFLDPEYRNIFVSLKDYEYRGYFKQENDEREKAAVTFVEEDYRIKKSIIENDGVYTDENGKEYYAYVVKNPEVDETALYGNMFAISANSVRSQACMQILTLINTNAEARNILQYGVEGVNFQVVEEKTPDNQLITYVERLNEDYMMSIERTGNCFIAYPDPKMGAKLTIAYWENAAKQNNDALISPLLGFNFDTEIELDVTLAGFETDEELIEYYADCYENKSGYPALDFVQWNRMVNASQCILDDINKCTSVEELNAYLDEVVVSGSALGALENNSSLATLPQTDAEGNRFKEDGQPITTNINFGKLTSTAYDGSETNDTDGESPYTVYYNWMMGNGFYPGIVEDAEDEEAEDAE